MVTELKPIEGSSQVAAMGYDPASQTLAVQFKNSSFRYDYAGVPPDVAEKVTGAASVGAALNEHIKKGGFEFSKIDMSEDD